MGAISAETFLTRLKSLLELPTIVPVGVNVGVDIARISKFGVKFTRFKDLIVPWHRILMTAAWMAME